VIRAVCYSYDRLYKVDFDATAWFRQATDREITDLAASAFGDYSTADAVAYWMADHNPAIVEMVEYVNNPSLSQGLECYVHEGDATLWVRAHRPYLIEKGEVRKRPWGPKDWSPVRRSPKKKK
jgi:hypothetical protein